jgi:hypothetical protein
MAEHTRLHLWLNTGIACLAFFASAVSGLFAWKAYELKSESIGFNLAFTYRCHIEYKKLGQGGVLSLCWFGSIANQSDSRISIISARAVVETERGEVEYGGFTYVQDNISRALFPIVIDAGEARPYTFRVPTEVPHSVADIVDGMLAKGSGEFWSLETVMKSLADKGLDILGNSVEVRKFDENQFLISWPQNHRSVVGALRFYTGRGNTFVVRTRFPPAAEQRP